jgi:4-alpha-glucanotransferase
VTLPSLYDRAFGVLLHPTSLPGPHGAGDLGASARKLVDWLAQAGARWWQMLPVGPLGYGNSPYSSLSAFAGNPLLVPVDEAPARPLPAERVDYAGTTSFRLAALERAFSRNDDAKALEEFRAGHQRWLPDFALYGAIKDAHGGRPWWEWPAPLRSREKQALADARVTFAARISFHERCQLAFDRAWRALREHAESRGVALIGDLPIFVAHDSSDVWAHPELFKLDELGRPTAVAGVPPDYFSATGQRWGNPLYRWDRMGQDGYAWWIDRVRVALERFHALRLDHFIGFQRYWEIPASCPTAVDGKWLPGPGAELFRALERALGKLPLIAEDLGAVTPEVTALRDQFQLPGIRILQFAFGTDPQAPNFKPHNYPRNAVAYTGSHDNDTVIGWFRDPGGAGSTRTPEECDRERRLCLEYLGSDGREVHWDMIRTLAQSVAHVVIAPLQDLLGQGTEARMNLPGTVEHNWEWRFREGELSAALAARIRRLCEVYER